jgi:hypothetical protein
MYGRGMKGLSLVELSKKQAQFYAVLVSGCVAIAILVLLIDFNIKASILDESARLREVINGQRPAGPNDPRTGADHHKYSPVSGDVLPEQRPRMEKRDVANGFPIAVSNPGNGRGRWSDDAGKGDDKDVPTGDKSLGTRDDEAG